VKLPNWLNFDCVHVPRVAILYNVIYGACLTFRISCLGFVPFPLPCNPLLLPHVTACIQVRNSSRDDAHAKGHQFYGQSRLVGQTKRTNQVLAGALLVQVRFIAKVCFLCGGSTLRLKGLLCFTNTHRYIQAAAVLTFL
jgi:hypothetical protein